jgi:type VII secretion integral membrane protein EccD
LPDAGQTHGGWLLRRPDGSALSVGAGLAQQGIRDGDVLHLVPARIGWPELEYDDVVDAIAAGARRYGRGWDGAATRIAGLAGAALALLIGGAVLVRSPAGSAAPAAFALGVGALLLVSGAVAARGFGDGVVGAAVGGFALPYAAIGGYLLLHGVPGVLVGATALLLAGMIGAVGVGHGLRVFVAGITAGCFGALGALLAYWQPVAGAAAVVLATLITGVAAFPLLAIRLGRLPMPVVPPQEEVRPDRARVFAAVIRTDELVTGMLLGHAVATLGAAALLVGGAGGVAGRILVAVAAVGLLVRARLFPTVRQRLPLLAGGAGGVALLILGSTGLPRLAIAGVLTGAGLVAVLAGATYRRRAPGPYLGRAADLLDALCVVGVIPVACAVLGLYGRMRGLIG